MREKIIPLLAAIFVFLSGLLSWPAAPFAQGSNEGFSVDAKVALHATRALVEQRLGAVLSGLETLAATDEAKSGNWERLKAPLAQLGQGTAIAAAVWFAKPDGSYYTVEKGLTDQNVKDRDYFAGLMAGRTVDGDLIVSRSTGKKSVVVAAPIAGDGGIIGAIGVSISVEKLAAEVDGALRLPRDVVFYALDPLGRTAIHRESSLMFEFPTEQGSESLSAAVKEMLSRPEGTVHYAFRGAQKTAIFEKSDATGWVFVLGISHAPLRPAAP